MDMKDEKGMLSVEAVLSLVPFIVAILGIISFIDIFMIHNKIQYAMYEAAHELTAYTYFYHVSGAREADGAFDRDRKKAEKPVRDEITNVLNFTSKCNALKDSYDKTVADADDFNISGMGADLESLAENAKGVKETGQTALQGGLELLKDPKKLAAALAYFLVGEAKDWAKSQLLAMVTSYMVKENLDVSSYKNKDILQHPVDADRFLKSYGVVDGIEGLDFTESQLFMDDRHQLINIVCKYDIEVYFFKLFFTDPVIHVVQRVEVPAWLGGDDAQRYYNTQ